ncbi:MAG TPA: hypothetical protein VFN10_20775 [Thermoanaerobaculia bacterium]|nr:hypothetical protein [Thermoanaerobaculia bacterium]
MSRDRARIASYHRSRANAEAIDDRTWSDLDLDDVVAALDTCRSGAGEQLLYDIVRTPRFDRETLHAREAQLSRVVTQRGPIARELESLRKADLYDVHQLFTGELPDRPRFPLIFPLISLLSILSVASVFLIPQAIFLAITMALVTFSVYFTYRRRIYAFIQPVSVLKRLLDAGDRIARVLDDEPLRRAVGALAPLRATARWLFLEQFQSDNLVSMLYQYFNMFLLLDVNAFVFSLETIRNRRDALETLFLSVGTIDALLAVADFRASRTVCEPSFLEREKEARFTGIVHPLLDDGVANDIDIRGRGILVTGSNMSGKTTFLRTLGVNAVLAQTIHTAVAHEYAAPFLRVRTSIGKADSLLEGKSYYLREVDDIGALVAASSESRAHLFIVDELFRGTNTRERVAAGCAVLRHLNRGPHLVLASTHDLELVALLADSYEFHHFSEQVSDGDLLFDYRLKSGPSSTRNAIAILEMRGFPESLVEQARELAGGDPGAGSEAHRLKGSQ